MHEPVLTPLFIRREGSTLARGSLVTSCKLLLNLGERHLYLLLTDLPLLNHFRLEQHPALSINGKGVIDNQRVLVISLDPCHLAGCEEHQVVSSNRELREAIYPKLILSDLTTQGHKLMRRFASAVNQDMQR